MFGVKGVEVKGVEVTRWLGGKMTTHATDETVSMQLLGDTDFVNP